MSEPEPAPPPRATFPTTHWSRVLMAGDRAEPEARAAMARLCADYWYPLYVFVRRKGYGPDEAADLVQGTFADLLAREGLGGVEPARGRFRSYLMAACAHHIADRRDRDRAARRGGGRPPVPIDRLEAEGRYGAEPAHRLTAERHFERRWALEMLGRAVGRLEAEMAAAGKADLFARLLPALTGGRGEVSHADVAAGLGMTAGAVKTAASRLRRRYGELLREEVARTVAGPDAVDEEVRDLFAALAP
jgi:DNA-directed RNA polymerase specialized sigma24 family protein